MAATGAKVPGMNMLQFMKLIGQLKVRRVLKVSHVFVAF